MPCRVRVGVLLMSHLGNWEVAARLLKKTLPDLKMMLYMGVKQQEQIEAMQKQVVRRSDIRIVAVDESGGSPFDIVESVRFLREGGLVSLTGDRVWHVGQRTVPVRFSRAHHTSACGTLSAGHGLRCPHLCFFSPCAPEAATISSAHRSRLSSTRPIVPNAIRPSPGPPSSMQTLLEKDMSGAYPFQWHHFEPFVGK